MRHPVLVDSFTLSKLGVHWPEEGGDDEENSSKLIEEGK